MVAHSPNQDDRIFWTFWTASSTSYLGTAITALAFQLSAVIVLDATAFQLGALGAASYAAWILIGLPAGPLVMRFPLRDIQVALDLVRAIAIASVPLTWWLDRLTFTQMLVVALIVSFADVVFDTANSTFVPRVVPREVLMRRNSLISGTYAVTQVGGQSLGGVLISIFGAVPTLLIDSATYVVSAVLLRSLPPIQEPDPGPTPRIRDTIISGWRCVNDEPLVRASMWSSATINFVSGGQIAVFVFYLTQVLETPTGWIGVLMAVDGVASLAGAWLALSLSRKWGVAKSVRWGIIAMALGAILIPIGDGVAAWASFAIGLFIHAAGIVVVTTATRTYRQIVTPEAMLPAVSATVRFVAWGAIPFGSLATGVFAEIVGPRVALVALAVVSLGAVKILLSAPLVRFDEVVVP